MPESARSPFSYAILRVVPRVERGECFNAGVVLFCRQRGFLAATAVLDRARLAALMPGSGPLALAATATELEDQLQLLTRVAAGEAGAGPIAALAPSERFGWLVAAASTMIQPSEVHTGLCLDPAATLEELFARLVGPVADSPP